MLSQCVARKVPELCKAYTPGKGDQDVNLRLARLEHIIEIALPQFCAPGTPNSSFDTGAPGDRNRSPSMQEDDHSQPEDQDANNGIFQSGKWYGNSASGSVAPASVLEQVRPTKFHRLLAGHSDIFLYSCKMRSRLAQVRTNKAVTIYVIYLPHHPAITSVPLQWTLILIPFHKTWSRLQRII